MGLEVFNKDTWCLYIAKLTGGTVIGITTEFAGIYHQMTKQNPKYNQDKGRIMGAKSWFVGDYFTARKLLRSLLDRNLDDAVVLQLLKYDDLVKRLKLRNLHAIVDDRDEKRLRQILNNQS